MPGLSLDEVVIIVALGEGLNIEYIYIYIYIYVYTHTLFFRNAGTYRKASVITYFFMSKHS